MARQVGYGRRGNSWALCEQLTSMQSMGFYGVFERRDASATHWGMNEAEG